MTDRILDRLASRGSNGTDGDESRENDDIEDLGTFGFLRGSRERATMLELRKTDGGILAVAYGYMDRAEFDPSDGITLHLAGRTIRVKGRNLNREVCPKVRLFEAICRHRVPWLHEAGEAESLAADGAAAIVESIEW